MIEFVAAAEASDLAQALKRSRWVYPLINAGHVAGLGVLIGCVLAMDLRLLGLGRALPLAATLRYLRALAVGALVLAVASGSLLFITQAGDYAANTWFRVKLVFLALALINAAVHLNIAAMSPPRQRRGALLSMTLWPAVLISGRMIAYS